MVNELIVTAGMFLVLKASSSVLPASDTTALFGGTEIVLEDDSGHCRLNFKDGSVLLNVTAPCWFAVDAGGRPYRNSSSEPEAQTVFIVVASPYSGPLSKAQRKCGTVSQAVLIDAAGVRTLPRVAHGGVRCQGEPLDPAEWWLFLNAH